MPCRFAPHETCCNATTSASDMQESSSHLRTLQSGTDSAATGVDKPRIRPASHLGQAFDGALLPPNPCVLSLLLCKRTRARKCRLGDARIPQTGLQNGSALKGSGAITLFSHFHMPRQSQLSMDDAPRFKICKRRYSRATFGTPSRD